MSLAPLAPSIPQAAPAANRVLPFSRVPPAPVPGIPAGIPGIPAPKIPLSPIPPVYLQPVDPDTPLDPGAILPPGVELPPAPVSPALPGAVDAAQDLFNPDDSDWSPAPWNTPDTPASLVPPTSVPDNTEPYPGNYPGAPLTHTARVLVQNRRSSGTIIELQYTAFPNGTPVGWEIEFGPWTSSGGFTYNAKYYYYKYRQPNGTLRRDLVTFTLPLSSNDAGGDREISSRYFIIWPTVGEIEPDPAPLVDLTPAPPKLFIPTPAIPLPIPAPLPAPLPAPQPAPLPAPLPAPPDPEEPKEDPIPVIPLPIPIPIPSPQPAPIPKTAPVNPAPGGNPAQPTPSPTPGPGVDPKSQEPRKLPPLPFDVCDIECLQPPDCEPIVILQRRSVGSQFSQELDFSTALLGQFCSDLPQNIAAVAVDVIAVGSNLKTFTAFDNGDEIGQFGTLSVVVDGRPIQEYTLSRFQRTIVQIPYLPERRAKIAVAPIFGCRVQITDLGDRWGAYRVTDSTNLPIISADVLT